MKSRDELRTATVRLALSAIRTEEVAGDGQRDLDDAGVVRVLAREAKKRRESAETYAGAGRADLADRERAEADVLAEYLPAQLGDTELAELVASTIAETGAAGRGGIGTVMKSVQPRVAGRADGARVAAEVRRQLGS